MIGIALKISYRALAFFSSVLIRMRLGHGMIKVIVYGVFNRAYTITNIIQMFSISEIY